MTHALGAGRDLQAEMVGWARRVLTSIHLMLPSEHPAAEHRRLDSEAIAHGLEGERMAIRGTRHYPAFGIDIQQPFTRASRKDSLLVHVQGVREQRQHQALFAGEAMPA
ncbi:MAG TPA: hypothetical protein VKE70_35660 [Candidatus Solibacter sp.]|nr:hypothetical protein [Candidatus Solibacter sp.]